MCQITTVIKITEDEKVARAITNMMLEAQNTNDDGTGEYSFNMKGEFHHERKVFETLDGMMENLKKFDVINYHFRRSTGGELSEHNIHFWKIGNWALAHNGTATSYKEEKDSDTLALFKDLIRKNYLGVGSRINIKKIKKLLSNTTFWGRIVIINTQTKKMYFFGDFYAYYINRSYVVLTSCTETFEFKEAVSVLGLTFEADEETKLEVMEGKMDGIFSYDFENGFLIIDTEMKETTSYYNNLPKGFKKVNEKKEKKQLAITRYKAEDDEYGLTKAEMEYYKHYDNQEYQKELKSIKATFQEVVDRVGTNYTNENIYDLDVAEIAKEIAIDELNQRYNTESVGKETVNL